MHYCEKRVKMKKNLGILLFCVLLFIGQLYIAERVMFGDDFIFATFARDHIFFYTQNAHPPLPVWSDILFTSLFSLSERTLRLTSILFATLTVGLVYIFTRRFYSENVAILSAIITGLSAWHIRASQMNSGSDGGMFTFFFFLTAYFFLLTYEKKESKYIIATGISAGFCLLSKETAFLLFIIMILYLGYDSRNNLKGLMYGHIKTIVLIGVIAAIVFSVFPLLDILYNNHQNIDAIIQRIDSAVIHPTSQESYSSLSFFVYSLFKILLWVGPLLLCFPLLSRKNLKEHNKKEISAFFYITLGVIFSFYLIFVPSNLDKTRYLMIIIPFIAILSAQGIIYATKNFQKRHWLILGILSVLFSVIFLMLNTQINVISYESNENPFIQLEKGNTNLSIPVFTETDNSGFLLNFNIFLLTYIFTGILLTIVLFKKESIAVTISLILLLSICLAYNFIIVEEYGFHLTSPNYSDAIKELVAYGQQYQLKEPLYILKNYELQYYFGDNYTHFVTTYGLSDTDSAKIAQLQEELQTVGGTIIFTDMPPIDRQGLLWQTINSCTKEVTIIDKNIEIGYIFTCNPS